MSFFLLLLIIGLLLIVGLALLAVGWRGKRLNNHPVCRKCGFDLFNLYPDRAACPECGALLTPKTVRLGQRRKRRGLVAAGAVMALLGGGAIGVFGLAWAGGTNWQRYKPVWYLHMEATYGGTVSADAALDEMVRRIRAGGLSKGQLTGWVNDALTHQANRAKPWDPKWGDLIEQAHANKLLAAKDWKTYARQAIVGTLSLKVRPRVRRSDPIPWRLHVRHARVGDRAWSGSGFGAIFAWIGAETVTIGPIVKKNFGRMGTTLTNSGSGSTGSYMRFKPGELARLKPGRHTIEVEARITLHNSQSYGGSGPLIVKLPLKKLTGTFELLDVDTSTVTVKTDPSLKAAMEQSLSMNELHFENRNSQNVSLHGSIEVDHPPVGVAFNVYARHGDKQWDLGSISFPRSGKTEWGVGLYEDDKLTDFHAHKIDVVLAPSVKVAARTVDVFEIWGEPIVIKDVAVKWAVPGGQAKQGTAKP